MAAWIKRAQWRRRGRNLSKGQRLPSIVVKPGGLITNILTITGLFLTAIGLFGTTYAIMEGSLTRWQDLQLRAISQLEDRLYDFEKEDPSLLCLYRNSVPHELGCDRDHSGLSKKTIPYADVVIDLYVAWIDHDQTWCTEEWPVSAFKWAVQGCGLPSPYLSLVSEDPHGVFQAIAIDKFGSKEIACNEYRICFRGAVPKIVEAADE